MSFVNNKNERLPGPITGNALNGLCERACIQVRKVFDACMKQITLENIDITVTNQLPPIPVTPLTFVSAKSSTSHGIITNLMIDDIDDKPNISRIRADIGIPMEVLYTDANGVHGSGDAIIVVPIDIVLGIPEAAVIPSEIEAVVGAVAPIGEFVRCSTFKITCCITIIMKSVTNVELLVPTYGYCYIPSCQDFSQDVCTDFFDLPLFPSSNTTTTTTVNTNNNNIFGF